MAALLLTRAMTSMLAGIKPTDPVTFAAMAALFLLIAMVATWMPARRAAALDPSAGAARGVGFTAANSHNAAASAVDPRGRARNCRRIPSQKLPGLRFTELLQTIGPHRSIARRARPSCASR